jgi:hypothetical protein
MKLIGGIVVLVGLGITGACSGSGDEASYIPSATTWNFAFPGAQSLKPNSGEMALSESWDYRWTETTCDTRWGEYSGLFLDRTGRPGYVRVVAVGYRGEERVEATSELILASSLGEAKVTFTFREAITDCRFERAFKDRN